MFSNGAVVGSLATSYTDGVNMTSNEKTQISGVTSRLIKNGLLSFTKGSDIIGSESERLADHREKCALLFGNGERVIRRIFQGSGSIAGQVKYWDIQDWTTDADCELYVRNQSGQGIIAHGPDVPRLGLDGLLVHPDLTNLVDWSEQRFSDATIWAQSGVTSITPYSRDSADGMRYGALGVFTANGYIERDVTVVGSTEYTVLLDVRGNEAGVVRRLKWTFTTAASMTETAPLRIQAQTNEGLAPILTLVIEGGSDQVANQWIWGADDGTGDGTITWVDIREDDEQGSGTSLSWVIERVQLIAGDVPTDVYVRTTGAAATATAPIYDWTDGEALSRLNGGRIALRLNFEMPKAPAAGLPLLSFLADDSWLDLSFGKDEGEHTLYAYRDGESDALTDAVTLKADNEYQLFFELRSDGAFRCALIDVAASSAVLSETDGTLADWAGQTTTSVRFGCRNDGTDQAWLKCRKVQVYR